MKATVKELFENLKKSSFVKKNAEISENGLLAISELKNFATNKAYLVTSSKNGVVTTKYRRAKKFLEELGIKFIDSNDAPRGGMAGTYLLCSDADAHKWEDFIWYIREFNEKTLKSEISVDKINHALKK